MKLIIISRNTIKNNNEFWARAFPLKAGKHKQNFLINIKQGQHFFIVGPFYMSKNINIIPRERIISRIFYIRGKKVMFDRDLAELYGVETRVLNQAVSRNKARFPDDFMFQLTEDEMQNWISQIVISNREKMGLRRRSYVFKIG